MKNIFVLSDNIITSLGFTSRENLEAMAQGRCGIRVQQDEALYPSPLPLSAVSSQELNQRFESLPEVRQKSLNPDQFTRLEKMMILSVANAMAGCRVTPGDPKVLFILSTTKGNIDLLEERFKSKFDHKRVYLWALAAVIRDFFGFSGTPVIVSHACISGLVALIMASRMLRAGIYDSAVVTGGDILSEFVISGFQSFQALSASACRPFDLHRTGLSLGEGCGTIVLSTVPHDQEKHRIGMMGGSVSNDANHISGPSRTGEELSMAINKALAGSDISPGSLDFISAHGTATPFNDEMESRAFNLSRLSEIPLNSYKGYWGHTLGAAGIIESAALIGSLRSGLLIKSLGFESPGIPEPLNMIRETSGADLKYALKTASGFGGCNAALVFEKK